MHPASSKSGDGMSRGRGAVHTPSRRAEFQPSLPELDSAEQIVLLELFCSVTERDIDALATALAQGDVPEVRRLSHRIRGASISIGAAGMALVAGELEWHPHVPGAHASAAEAVRTLREGLREVQACTERMVRVADHKP